MLYEDIQNSDDIKIVKAALAVYHERVLAAMEIVDEQADSTEIWWGHNSEHIKAELRRLHKALEGGSNNPLLPPGIEPLADFVIDNHERSPTQKHVAQILADLKATDKDCISREEDYVAVDTQIDRAAWDALVEGQ